MARELRRRGVTHVVMEASGVYTEPVYYALCEQDFEQVAVINPAHAKALKGHKTDAKDCARLAELFECGLLRGSYIPAGGAEGGAGPDPVQDEDRCRPAPRRSSGWARRTYIKPMLIQAAWAAIRVRGRLQARYNRLVRRFGGENNPGAKKKAITAIAHTLLKIAYQVLKERDAVP